MLVKFNKTKTLHIKKKSIYIYRELCKHNHHQIRVDDKRNNRIERGGHSVSNYKV